MELREMDLRGELELGMEENGEIGLNVVEQGREVVHRKMRRRGVRVIVIVFVLSG